MLTTLIVGVGSTDGDILNVSRKIKKMLATLIMTDYCIGSYSAAYLNLYFVYLGPDLARRDH
jgi:hypothetical protein